MHHVHVQGRTHTSLKLFWQFCSCIKAFNISWFESCTCTCTHTCIATHGPLQWPFCWSLQALQNLPKFDIGQSSGKLGHICVVQFFIAAYPLKENLACDVFLYWYLLGYETTVRPFDQRFALIAFFFFYKDINGA